MPGGATTSLLQQLLPRPGRVRQMVASAPGNRTDGHRTAGCGRMHSRTAAGGIPGGIPLTRLVEAAPTE